MNELHLFAGAGGGILGGMLLGHTTVCAVEIEEYPRRVLLQRQRDGILPRFPIWDDVQTFDGKPWRGTVDILCGGFPCQDISAAGKRAGITGARSGLWKEYARLIGEIRPRFVFAENSPLLRTRGLGVVLEDLASLGYDARWCVLGARDVGAPHKRDRMWILAYATTKRLETQRPKQQTTGTTRESKVTAMANANDSGFKKQRITFSNAPKNKAIECRSFWHTDPAEVGNTSMLYAQGCVDGSWQGKPGRASERNFQSKANRATEPILGRVANGVANRVDRLKAIGNGQVPQCAAMAFRILSQGLTCEK